MNVCGNDQFSLQNTNADRKITKYQRRKYKLNKRYIYSLLSDAMSDAALSTTACCFVPVRKE